MTTEKKREENGTKRDHSKRMIWRLAMVAEREEDRGRLILLIYA